MCSTPKFDRSHRCFFVDLGPLLWSREPHRIIACMVRLFLSRKLRCVAKCRNATADAFCVDVSARSFHRPVLPPSAAVPSSSLTLACGTDCRRDVTTSTSLPIFMRRLKSLLFKRSLELYMTVLDVLTLSHFRC